MKTPEERERMGTRILERLRAAGPRLLDEVPVSAQVIQWYAVHAHLQLALRHPELISNDVRNMAEGMVRGIEDLFERLRIFDGEILEFLRTDQAEIEVEGRIRGANVFDEPTCIQCHCTETHACEGGCSWVELDPQTNAGICSACVDPAAHDNVELLTPRWSDRPNEQDPHAPVGYVAREGDEWVLYLFIEYQLYKLPVRDGDPEGELTEVAPGVKAWSEIKRYGLSRLGPGVWRLTPSLWVPGEIHAFIVLRDVPEPAPFSRPLLFSATGEALR